MSFTKLSPEQLRQHKGISFTGITTVFVCHDGHGKVFMAKKSAKTRDEHGSWEFGAGGLKHGQKVEDNLRRELMEEYGVEPIKTDFIGYFDAFRTSPDGHPTHWLAMCFAALVDPAKIKISEPEMFEDSAWFRLDSLPQPRHSQIDIFLDMFGDKLKQIMQIEG